MENKAQHDDELVISLVEQALARPEDQREAYLESACTGNSELFEQAWNYVRWEQRMNGFLLDPLCPAPENEHPFEPGQYLEGRFRIVRELARGGMGIVYEAVDEKLERRIAIKCARKGFRKRLPPEVRNAREISHPNVCKIFEIHTTETRQGPIDFITMEFLEGETLSERLQRGRFSQAEARAIAGQLCAGLAEAHRNRVVHGDLKSNNVILTAGSDGAVRAVITDFGLARQPGSAGKALQSGEKGGTPDYMAPELWRGEKASPASDIYAMGVILYELAAGRRPFATDIWWEDRITLHPPPVDRKWDRILARCLDPEPARRFGSGDEILQALGPSRSRKWLLAGAAAAVLALATGLVTYQRSTAPKESWRLAMPPIESGAETRDMAAALSRDATVQLTRLKGGNKARLSVIPLARGIDKATHVLHAALVKKDGKLILRAVLTDARTGVSGKEWTAEYAPEEMRYAPVALAGMVTSQLELPPLTVRGSVNPAAAQDYWSGLWYARRNSTVDTALPLLERAVAEDPDSPLTYAALAEARQWKWIVTKEAAWLDRAKEAERQAQRRNPDVAQVHRVAGLLSFRQHLYELAESECLRAIALDPNDGEAHRVLGRAYEKIDRLDEALAAFRKAVEVDPEDYRNHQDLGAFHYDRADYAEALPHFLKVVELAPSEPAAHYSLGADYFGTGHLPEAEHEIRLAIELGQTPVELHTLGIVLMEEENYQEAVDFILRALSLAPEQVSWQMNLGTAYGLLGLKAESEKAYRRALELAEQELPRNPDDGKIRSYLAFVCARLGQVARAYTDIGQALAQSPNDTQVRFMAAATYEALGRRDDTLNLLNTFRYAELADVSRWPDMAELSKSSRFLEMLASRRPNKEKR